VSPGINDVNVSKKVSSSDPVNKTVVQFVLALKKEFCSVVLQAGVSVEGINRNSALE
jgi:hypothetical protein